ncbi:DUF6192 family protein [Streptomyces sp. NPDC001793]|uniref:DUF6192 family protein n=1 Tax=Streptomyces sp. NPDC001793 TaxID=3154657 RepID=UPI00331A3DF7
MTGPKGQRQEGVSFEVHRILASAPDAYELIKSPPVNERTGRSQRSGHAAKRAAGWSTATPVAVEEKAEAIRDLVEEEGEGDWWDEPELEGEDEGEDCDPARGVRGFHRAMEFTDLIGVCQGFVAGAGRLVPKLRGREFTESQLAHGSCEPAPP